MTLSGNRKLRNYIIDWDLQFRVIAGSLVFMTFAGIIILVVVLFPLIRGMFSADMEIQYRSAQDFLLLVKRLLPVIILLFLFYIAHMIVVTHRICGPLVNFCHSFSRMREGDLLRRVYIRQGDFLRKECEKINEMIEGLSHIIIRVKEGQGRTIASLESMIARTEDLKTKEELEAALKLVISESQYVRDRLAQFQVVAPLVENDKIDRNHK